MGLVMVFPVLIGELELGAPCRSQRPFLLVELPRLRLTGDAHWSLQHL